MRRKIAVLVSMVMIISMCNVVAFASDTLPTEVETPDVIASMEARFAESELLDYLDDNGIAVNPNDQLVAVSSSENSQDEVVMLKVIQENDNHYDVYTLISLDAEANPVDSPISVAEPTMMRTNIGQIIWEPNWDDAITINVMASYDTLLYSFDGLVSRIFLQPKAINFTYSYNHGYVSVEYINVILGAQGAYYDANFNFIQADYQAEACRVFKNNPNAGVVYSASGSLPSGVNIEYVGLGAGVFAEIEASVDGNYDYHSSLIM